MHDYAYRRDETQLLLCLASLPCLMGHSWCRNRVQQNEPGASLGKPLDMTQLLCRLDHNDSEKGDKLREWAGSGLGAEWDDRVGAGQAAASIVSRQTKNLGQLSKSCEANAE